MNRPFFKTFLLLCFISLLTASNTFCQGEKLSFSETKTVKGVNAKELFNRAQNSINKSFSESNLELLEVDEDGRTFISGKSIVSFSAKDAQLRTVASGSVSFEFEVDENSLLRSNMDYMSNPLMKTIIIS